MSAQFLQQSTPQENHTIKVNDVIARGLIKCDELLSCPRFEVEGGAVTLAQDATSAATIAASGKLILPVIGSAGTYTQATNNVTAVSITRNEQQFVIRTFSSGSPAGSAGGDIAVNGSASFVVSHSGVVAVKTFVEAFMLGSYNGLTKTACSVTTTGNGSFTVTRHNFGSAVAVGVQELGFRLTQIA